MHVIDAVLSLINRAIDHKSKVPMLGLCEDGGGGEVSEFLGWIEGALRNQSSLFSKSLGMLTSRMSPKVEKADTR